ncbi:restriction endonuclease subunit S [Parabacteroides sp. W1-Q-101]|uniref:restriction endonuclease subunit S n=1 Tax=Parabacteroides caeci TaxID=2949650 RepID=UPI00202DFECD|nr:restriction endonuclease subunit S [Parabacteroides sp. W1-Q-101]MCM0718948.1 restriction endonuclease subunit S [Parabacteroides sp. W1-Q-101]
MSQFIEMFGNPLSLNQKNELKRLGECCILNPRRPNIALCDTDKVSFIPMPAVSEDGYLVDMTDEEYGKVKKGFTYFENNDVLFAKITPCMENGKGAIVHGLTNGIGMGSTEFHVLRPINGISSPYWLLALTRMPIFRERAAKNMSGTGGQKRVSASYLDHFMVGLPAIEEQRRFEAIYRQADKSKFGDFKSQFIEMFGDSSVVRLEDKIATQSGGTPNTKKLKYYEGGNIPWLSSSEVNQGYIFSTEKFITQEGLDNSSARWIPKDSVLIAMYGATAGRVGLSTIPLTTNQAVCALLPCSSFNPIFLYYAVCQKTPWMISQCRGAAQPNISQGIIRSMELPIPPMAKQMQFVSIAKQADKSKSVIQKALVYLNDIQSDELRKIA